MRTAEGSLPMETIWSPADDGRTRMTLRNRGEPSGFARVDAPTPSPGAPPGHPSGFSRVAAPLMAAAVRRANRSDLRKLKRLLEAGG